MSTIYIFISILLLFILQIQANKDIVNFHWKGKLSENSADFRILPIYAQNDPFYMIFYEKSLLKHLESNTQLQNQKIQQFTLTPEKNSRNTQKMLHLNLKNLNSYTEYEYFFQTEKLNTKAEQLEKIKFHQNLQKKQKYFRLFTLKTHQKKFVHQKLTFVASSCARTASESDIFTEMAEHNPDLFIQMGDLHYRDIGENNEQLFEEAFQYVFNTTRQNYFYSQVPVSYVWDDHDFGENDSGADNPAKEAVNKVYRDYVPHYPVPQDNAIYQHYVIGRSLFIITDPRSFFTPKTMFGEQQNEWILSILNDEELTKNLDFVFLICGVHWLEDDWQFFQKEQKRISDALEKLHKQGIFVMTIGGDAHMSGFDNGSNNPFGSFPVLVASPMDKFNSCKGGKYIYGPYLYNEQFAKVTIQEDKCVEIEIYRLDERYFTYNTCNEEDIKINRSNECPAMIPMVIAYIIFGAVTVTLIIIFITYFIMDYQKNAKRDRNMKKRKQIILEKHEKEKLLQEQRNKEKQEDKIKSTGSLKPSSTIKSQNKIKYQKTESLSQIHKQPQITSAHNQSQFSNVNEFESQQQNQLDNGESQIQKQPSVIQEQDQEYLDKSDFTKIIQKSPQQNRRSLQSSGQKQLIQQSYDNITLTKQSQSNQNLIYDPTNKRSSDSSISKKNVHVQQIQQFPHNYNKINEQKLSQQQQQIEDDLLDKILDESADIEDSGDDQQDSKYSKKDTVREKTQRQKIKHLSSKIKGYITNQEIQGSKQLSSSNSSPLKSPPFKQ